MHAVDYEFSPKRRHEQGSNSVSVQTRIQPNVCKEPWEWTVASCVVLSELRSSNSEQLSYTCLEGGGGWCKLLTPERVVRKLFQTSDIQSKLDPHIQYMATITSETQKTANHPHQQSQPRTCFQWLRFQKCLIIT